MRSRTETVGSRSTPVLGSAGAPSAACSGDEGSQERVGLQGSRDPPGEIQRPGGDMTCADPGLRAYYYSYY